MDIKYVSRSFLVIGVGPWVTCKVITSEDSVWFADFNVTNGEFMNFREFSQISEPVITDDWVTLREFMQENCPEVVKKNDEIAAKKSRASEFISFLVTAGIVIVSLYVSYKSFTPQYFTFAAIVVLGINGVIALILTRSYFKTRQPHLVLMWFVWGIGCVAVSIYVGMSYFNLI